MDPETLWVGGNLRACITSMSVTQSTLFGLRRLNGHNPTGVRKLCFYFGRQLHLFSRALLLADVADAAETADGADVAGVDKFSQKCYL